MTLQKLLDFIDTYSIDPQIFVLVRSLYQKTPWEVLWRSGAPKPWELKPKGGAQVLKVSTAELVATLNEHQLDLTHLEEQLQSAMLQQVWFANCLQSKASDLFGRRVIEDAKIRQDGFLETLRLEIEKITQSKPQKAPPASKPEKKKSPSTRKESYSSTSNGSKSFLRLFSDGVRFD